MTYHRSLLLLSSILHASPLAAQAERSCALPTESREWSPFRETRRTANSSEFSPTWPRVLSADRPAVALAGRYELWMISLAPTVDDSLATGTLELVPALLSDIPDAHSRQLSPLLGWADIELGRLGRLPVAHPVGSRDRQLPGVRLTSNPRDGRVELVVGNSVRYGDNGLIGRTTHVGINLFVIKISGDTLVGRWIGGGNVTPSTNGYFCAWRTRTDAK